jgi:ArsR family transcriptional regulator
MNRGMGSELQTLAAVSRALGDETRLRILNMLVEQGETCVCELMEMLGTTQSNVSFHLTVLKNAGLTTDKKIGKWMFYRVDLEALERHLASLRALFDKKRPAAACPGTSIFTLCCREDAVPLSRKHARQKVAELNARHKGKRMRATGMKGN